MDKARIDDLLWRADREWTVAAMTNATMLIMTALPRTTFAHIERWLRRQESRVYLVGKSPGEAPPGVRLMMPPKLVRPAKFWIWFCLNGESEMLDEIAKMGISRAQNLARLPSTGVITYAKVS